MNSLRRVATNCAAFALASIGLTNFAHAQTVRITAANASNSQIYDVTFQGAGGSITVLNNDQSSHVSLRSLVYAVNTSSGQIDLLVADTSRGQVLRYANAVGGSQLIWDQASGVAHPAEGAGPTAPDGLSVDAAGNLFVTSSAPGASTQAEVWVLPANGTGGYGLPLLVDRSFGGVTVRLLEESLFVRTAAGGASLGDLLVLAGDPATVFRYSATAIASVIGGGGPVNPTSTLLGPNKFPANEAPGGMDFWPVDSSLLITTGKGRVLRFASNGAQLADFAGGLGNGKFKIRTGYESSVPLAVVADNNGGDILKFGAPPSSGLNPPIAIVTAGVQRPQGVAVSNIAAVPFATCAQSAGGCNALGNVLKHNISGSAALPGAIVEDPCIVPVDPRIAQFGTCRGHTLNVATVCAGYENIVIPDFLCGGSGASGKGFALVNTTTTSTFNSLNAVVFNEANFENVIGGANGPTCPVNVLGWAPKSDEGSIVEGAAMLEITGGCGSSRGLTRDLSIWGIGLALDVGALPGKNTDEKLRNFAISKYSAITATIGSVTASIADTTEVQLTTCLANSRKFFDHKKYLNAAGELLACDQVIAQNPAAFSATTANPNPSGELRGRLANLYLTINTRIVGNAPNAAWPP